MLLSFINSESLTASISRIDSTSKRGIASSKVSDPSSILAIATISFVITTLFLCHCLYHAMSIKLRPTIRREIYTLNQFRDRFTRSWACPTLYQFLAGPLEAEYQIFFVHHFYWFVLPSHTTFVLQLLPRPCLSIAVESGLPIWWRMTSINMCLEAENNNNKIL